MSLNIKQYERLAIVALRLVGLSSVIMGLVWCLYALAFLLPGGLNAFVSYFVPTLLYIIFGILLFILSKPLAALTLRGLKDE